MAKRKSSAGTVIAIIIAVVAGVWILPRLLAALRSGRSGSTSGVSALPPLLKLPPPKPPQPSKGGGVGFGGGAAPPGGTPSTRGLAQALAGWINNVVTYGWRAAAQMPIYQSGDYLNGLGIDPSLSIPLEPTSLFDVGQLATDIPGLNGLGSPDVIDPSFTDQQIPYQQTGLFDVNQMATDIPGYDSGSSSGYNSSSNTGIDPYYGADQLSLYYNDLSNVSIGGAPSGFDGSYAIDPTSVGY